MLSRNFIVAVAGFSILAILIMTKQTVLAEYMVLLSLMGITLLLLYTIEEFKAKEELRKKWIKKELYELGEWVRAEYDTRPNTQVKEFYLGLADIYRKV